jgi:hypothetical protein
LQAPYKLLWLYLLDDCDHAGIWNVELDVASIRIGIPLDKEECIKNLGNHIHIFDGGSKWFIPDFIEFQYGVLSIENRAHKSVLEQLEKYNLKGLISPLQGCKDKDKDKDMYKDKVFNKEKRGYREEKEIFDAFRKEYPGTKRGLDVEFENFRKKHNDWSDVLTLLLKRLNYQKEARAIRKNNNKFVPEWKKLETWINQRCWEEIINTENDGE